jgi:hypothetical protein
MHHHGQFTLAHISVVAITDLPTTFCSQRWQHSVCQQETAATSQKAKPEQTLLVANWFDLLLNDSLFQYAQVKRRQTARPHDNMLLKHNLGQLQSFHTHVILSRVLTKDTFNQQRPLLDPCRISPPSFSTLTCATLKQ